jgi:integrase
MKVRHQRGYIFTVGRGDHTAFHIRYYRTELVDGVEKRVQRSERLCMRDNKERRGAASKAVKDLAAKFMEKINAASGLVVSSDDMTVVDFFDNEYLPWYTESNKPDSVKNMREIFENELRKHFGDVTLRAYKKSMGRKLLATIEVKRSHDRLTKIKKVAHAIFSRAIDLQKFPDDAEINPWTLLKVKKEWGKPSEDTKWYTDEETRYILEALFEHSDAQLAFALAAIQALRHGEIRGLRWDDIDNGLLHIRRSVDSQRNVGTTKTMESERDIPIFKDVAFYLALWRSQWKGVGPWVMSETTEPINLTSFANRIIKPTLKAAAEAALAAGDKHKAEALTWKAWHAGRRGASNFIIDNGSLKLAQQLLGHKHATTTDDSYNKRMPERTFLEGLQAVDQKRLKN